MSPIPRPGAREVVVRVAACGVNFPDPLIIEDRYQFKPPRPVLAGRRGGRRIVSSAARSPGLRVGHRVLASAGSGGMAERSRSLRRASCRFPTPCRSTRRPSLLFTYGTTYHALKDRAHLQARREPAGARRGRRRRLGGGRTRQGDGRARHRGRLDAGESRFGDEPGRRSWGIVYPSGPFDKDGGQDARRSLQVRLRRSGADVIYDGVGGDYSEAALRAIAWEGRFLVVGFPAGIPRMPLNLPLLKGCDIARRVLGRFRAPLPRANAANNAELIALYGAGKIRPRIFARFPLARAGEAIALARRARRARQGRRDDPVTAPALTSLQAAEKTTYCAEVCSASACNSPPMRPLSAP